MNDEQTRAQVAAAFLLRLTLGLLFFVAGLNKVISGPSGIGQHINQKFSETWLPAFLYVPFGAVLPWAELILGILIILGLFRCWSVLLGGLLMVSLTFGNMVTGDHGTVSSNVVYVGLFAAALLTGHWDQIKLDRLMKK